MSRIFHCCFELTYLERLPDSELAKVFKDPETGKSMVASKARAVLAIKKAQGWDAIPLCDKYDNRGHCLGHSKEELNT